MIRQSYVTLNDCKIESSEADPTPQLQANAFINEFNKDAVAADEKYKEKQITLLQAVVESKEEASLMLVGPFKPKGAMPIKIKATWPFESRKQLENLKAGQRVTIKGEYSSFADGTIYINRCWLVP